MNKAALIILDGWGIGDKSSSDAIFNANTPEMDRLLQSHSHSELKTFGENVGLPEGQMGNSEVGHLNIGAGRIVFQDFARINNAISEGTLENNQALKDAIRKAERDGGTFHLMGLVSGGGVHSHINHLKALIKILEESKINKVYVHAFTDGRDTDPKSAAGNMRDLESFLDGKRTRLATMIGRYYAMDRDLRWQRIKKAYDLLIDAKGEAVTSFSERAEKFYEEGLTDEFFEAVTNVKHNGTIKEGDTVLCFNFRTDRCRQITTALTQKDMPEFGLETLPLNYVTMTKYDESFKGVSIMFEKENLTNTLGEVIAKAGGSQIRMAETEKYPHVTFFFSGGREEVFENESRKVIPSPKVATYDLKPEMSAFEVAEEAATLLKEQRPDFLCLNFANPDMVGHTGDFGAIVKAVEATDQCLSKVLGVLDDLGYETLIIADHGNADKAANADGSPNTAHTLNLVPCIYVSDKEKSLNDGILADVAPTLLDMMNISQPKEMTGVSLLLVE